MLAVHHAMSESAQFIVYLIAFIAFVVAAVLSILPPAKNWWAVLVATGLALFALVLFWNALAAS